MSIHPNVILAVRLTPDNLSRKTFRSICEAVGTKEDDAYFKIGKEDYSILLMEGSYDESNQISAKEGDIVVFDLVTYGYGETITWEELRSRAESLKQWALQICENHQCTYEVFVTANYW